MSQAHQHCDGLQDVSILSGIVRMDFFHYAPGEPGADGKPVREHALRLCMSPEAFVQTYSTLDRVVRELENRGLVARRAGQTAAAPAAPATAAAPASANF
ncbi:MAG: hypothetical protein RLZZ271_161 [Pseudomonadota bacterium]|jgi:hypothetical protein